MCEEKKLEGKTGGHHGPMKVCYGSGYCIGLYDYRGAWLQPVPQGTVQLPSTMWPGELRLKSETKKPRL